MYLKGHSRQQSEILFKQRFEANDELIGISNEQITQDSVHSTRFVFLSTRVQALENKLRKKVVVDDVFFCGEAASTLHHPWQRIRFIEYGLYCVM